MESLTESSSSKLWKYCKNNKLFQTRSPKKLGVYIFTIAFAFALLIFGLSLMITASLEKIPYNYYLNNAYNTQSSPTLIPTVTQEEQTHFNLPTPYENESISITIDFAFSSNSYFAQNTLVTMKANATVNNKSSQKFILSGIQALFTKAQTAYPDESSPLGYIKYSYSEPYTARMYISQPWQTSQPLNVLTGEASLVYSENCSVTSTLKFVIDYNYSNPDWSNVYHYLESKNSQLQREINVSYCSTVFEITPISELSIVQMSNINAMAEQRQSSAQNRISAYMTALFEQNEAEQDKTDKMNLGLSFVIIFLALIDLSFIIYEHTKDENREEQYDNKKSLEKQRDIV